MNNQLPDIDALLDHIYAQEEPISQDENQPRRTINVHIEVEEEAQELPPTVESSLNGQTIPMPQPDETETPTTNEQSSDFLPFQSSRRLPMRRTRFVMLVLSLVAVLGLLIGGGYNFVLPLFAPSATITLVTTSQHLTTTSTVQLVTSGTADPTKQQVPGRALPAMTMSQQKTEATTGTAHQDAKVGRGIITFYNGATFTQTILAGTALTGADGVQLVTDADAIIPPAAFPTFGQRTVAAHAATTGPGGNVRAGDVYGACCRLNVFAVSGAFTGGQNARTYQTITSQDIDRVVTSITTSLEQSVQAALQTQVQPTETLVPPSIVRRR